MHFQRHKFQLHFIALLLLKLLRKNKKKSTEFLLHVVLQGCIMVQTTTASCYNHELKIKVNTWKSPPKIITKFLLETKIKIILVVEKNKAIFYWFIIDVFMMCGWTDGRTYIWSNILCIWVPYVVYFEHWILGHSCGNKLTCEISAFMFSFDFLPIIGHCIRSKRKFHIKI